MSMEVESARAWPQQETGSWIESESKSIVLRPEQAVAQPRLQLSLLSSRQWANETDRQSGKSGSLATRDS